MNLNEQRLTQGGLHTPPVKNFDWIMEIGNPAQAARARLRWQL